MRNDNRYKIVLFFLLIPVIQAYAIELVVSTETSNVYLDHDSLEVNISIREPNLDAFKFNWNGTNYSSYDYSLALAMNFNNNSAIGENATKAVDISKYRNNGIINGATWVTTGKFSGAFQFDGVNDYVNAGNNSSLNPTDEITLEMWIYPSNTTSTAAQGLIGGESDAFRNRAVIRYDHNNRRILTFIGSDTSYLYSNTNSIVEGAWNHIVAVAKSGNYIRLYINGKLDTQTLVGVSDMTFYSANMYIGRVSNYYFNGSIDEVRIYDRVLTDNEIGIQFQSEFQKVNSTNYRYHNNITCSNTTATQIGHLSNSSVFPIGGGPGYSKIILNDSSVDVKVSTKTELLSALSTAVNGDIIYVNDSAKINLTDKHDLIIPAGVILASGRGNGSSQGALLYSNYSHYTGGTVEIYKLFVIGGEGVRFTGLRLRGEWDTTGADTYDYSVSRGIYSEYNVEVDNSEIYDWSHCGICVHYVMIGKTPYLHNNYIHNNQKAGLGYGISVAYNSTALIEANIFDWNRHSITGSGDINTSYAARYNLVLGNGTGHAFDMHGGVDRLDGTDIAGKTINIYDNTFNKIYDITNSYESEAILIRGIPTDGAYIYNNYLYYNNQAESIKQVNAFGNMNVYDNCFLGSCDSNYIRDGTYTYYGWASDIWGNSNSSEIRTITVNRNNRAPIFSLISSNGSVFNENDTILISINASDPDNDSLTYSIKIDDIQVSTSSNYQWKTSNNSSGYHKINISISDGTQTVTGSIAIYINNVYLRYDVDENGIINTTDIVITAQHINEIMVAPYSTYDVNMDGIVNILDIRIIGYHFGEST